MSADRPGVTVVVPTRNRPALLERAVDAVLAQDYSGVITVVVVVDRHSGDTDVPDFDDARVTVVDNDRTAGLAGARNTGILAATTELVAFCDDDDEWRPAKLDAQVTALTREPAAAMCTTAIEIDFDGARNVRLAGSDLVTHAQLLPSRMSMLHSSTFLFWRAPLLADIGLVDEHVPGSQNEDWDLLLRASAIHPIVNVDQPLVRVQWTARSYFSRDWDTKISSLLWMLEHHPDIDADRVGAARVYGQIAFAHAAARARRDGATWALKSMRRSWREPRAYLALATAAGVPADFVQHALHRRGHGI